MAKLTTQETIEQQNRAIQELQQNVQYIKQLCDVNILRHEAMVRHQVENKGFTFDEYAQSIELFKEYLKKLQELNADSNMLSRITAAKTYNAETTGYKVYADDIGIIDQLTSVGSVSEKTAESVLELPHTAAFKKLLEELKGL